MLNMVKFSQFMLFVGEVGQSWIEHPEGMIMQQVPATLLEIMWNCMELASGDVDSIAQALIDQMQDEINGMGSKEGELDNHAWFKAKIMMKVVELIEMM